MSNPLFQGSLACQDTGAELVIVADNDPVVLDVFCEKERELFPSGTDISTRLFECIVPARKELLEAFLNGLPIRYILLDNKIPEECGGDEDYPGGTKLIRSLLGKDLESLLKPEQITLLPPIVLMTTNVASSIGENSDLPLFHYDPDNEASRTLLSEGKIPVFEKPKAETEWGKNDIKRFRMLLSDLDKHMPQGCCRHNPAIPSMHSDCALA